MLHADFKFSPVLALFVLTVAFQPLALAAGKLEKADKCPILFQNLAKPRTRIPFRVKQLEAGTLRGVHMRSGIPITVRGEMTTREEPGATGAKPDIDGKLFLAGRSRSPHHFTAGYVRVRYSQESRNLEIIDLNIFLQFQGQGLSTVAVGQTLTSFPRTRTMSARLTEENYRAFMRELRRAKFEGRADGENRSQAVEESFRATPLFKIMRSLGFKEVDMENSFYDPGLGRNERLVLVARKTKPAALGKPVEPEPTEPDPFAGSDSGETAP